MREPGIPISHSILVVTIWGQEYKANREHLRVVISSFRSELEDDPSDPRNLYPMPVMAIAFAII